MPRTKILDLNIGDIVESKKYGNVLLITYKHEKHYKPYDDLYLYWYRAIDLLNGRTYSLCSDINNKHYKVLV